MQICTARIKKLKKEKIMYIHGVINSNNCLIDISISEQATKRYATLNGYNKIGCRNVNSYNAMVTHEKINKKWVECLVV